MPTTLYVPREAERSGVAITWTRTAHRIDIFGWYDSYVGIESQSFDLREFLDLLGITERDVQKAFKSGGGDG